MARPKGAKDKAPRKPRSPKIPADRGANVVEAPFGYGANGLPLQASRRSKTIPKTPEGRKKLHDTLVAKGLAKPMPTERNVGGRPEKYVDTEQLKRLALIDCTDEEMGLILGIGQDALARRYRDFIDEHRANGKASLRRLQLRIAQGQELEKDAEGNIVRPFIAPNAQMAVHLGKHRLGQKDAVGTTNIALLGNQGPNPQGGPGAYLPNMLSPETADILAREFMRICPDPALVAVTVVLDKSKEVTVA